MRLTQSDEKSQPSEDSVYTDYDPNVLSPWDKVTFQQLTTTDLTPQQEAQVVNPAQVRPRQREVLAIHWHPEWVPLALAQARVQATFPTQQHALVIPTQHNELLALDDFAGVEVDCYSQGFNRKVQLLLHFRRERLEQAGSLRSMLKHTQLYRSSQLWELVDSLRDPKLEERLQEAAEETGASQELVDFVRLHSSKFSQMLRDQEQDLAPIMVKNKLISDYFMALRQHFPRQAHQPRLVFNQGRQADSQT